MKKMLKVEKKVARLLEEYPNLRDDDEALIRKYRKIHDEYCTPDPSILVTGSLSIIRARQRLQAGGYYLPTSHEVFKQRRKQKIEMRRCAIGGKKNY